jgi:glutamate transport system permease protein
VDFVLEQRSLILEGFWTTLRLAALSGALSLLFGTVLAVMRVGPIPPLRWAGAVYVTLLRNTPLTLVFVFSTFGLPRLDIRLSFFAFAVVALTAYTSAFVCEAVRSGINSVSAGQAEASRAIGLTFGQSLREVVLPQAFRTVIPPLGNVFIAMVKNSSIAAGFAVSELSSLLPRLVNADAAQLTAVLLGVVIAYMLITVPLAFGVHRLERRVAILR